ncbi:DUF4344 domain-containing metallopeptidase [Gloeothece verrucosa]|nr:DUF4344 domain-containing metallopeptidase [Gloeothece verrucosa]
MAWGFDVKAKEVTLSRLNQILEKANPTRSKEIPAVNKKYSSSKGQFHVAYVPVEQKNYKLLEKVFVQSKFFENLAQSLNQIFVLPSNITIVLSECGQANAFYSPEHQAIIMCYELVEDFAVFSAKYARTDEELFNATLGGTMYVFIHELGHALIHVLDLPVLGKEEDAVDQLAVIIASQAGDFGELMAIIPATQYLLNSNETQATNVAYWDEHSLDIQRYYQIICLFYGSNPEKYTDLARLARLPEERAQKCPIEYQKSYNNWTRLLQPHLRAGF